VGEMIDEAQLLFVRMRDALAELVPLADRGLQRDTDGFVVSLNEASSITVAEFCRLIA